MSLYKSQNPNVNPITKCKTFVLIVVSKASTYVVHTMNGYCLYFKIFMRT